MDNHPFVFISYAHADWDKVSPILEHLKKAGVRYWYDEGIEAGSEWPEFIAQKVIDCQCFVLFLSPNYLASKHCKREMHYAITKKNEILSVHLEKVDLSPGMEMNLDMYQAIFRNRFKSDEAFYTSLCKEPFFKQCMIKRTTEESSTQEQKSPTSETTNDAAHYHKETRSSSLQAINCAIDACNDTLQKNKKPYSFKNPVALTQKQIENSLRAIAKSGVLKSEIVSVLDDTIFENGKSGYLITEDRFFSAGMLLETFSFNLNEIRAVSKIANTSRLLITFFDGSKHEYFFNNYTEAFLAFF